MDERRIELSKYRMEQSEISLRVAKLVLENKMYKDAINRSYYAAFYAIKAVLTLEKVDFKRHKAVIAHFNKNYVATGKFPKEVGRTIGTLQQIREKSDYDDFYVASSQLATEQVAAAERIISLIKDFLNKQ